MDENDDVEITPLHFLEAVYCNPNLPLATRLRAAIEAAPYKHPKLSAAAIATVNKEDFASMLDRCIERSGKTPVPLSPPKVINHEPVVTAEEMKRPFSRLNYRRF